MESKSTKQKLDNDFLNSLPTYHQERKIITSKTVTGHVVRVETTTVVKDEQQQDGDN